MPIACDCVDKNLLLKRSFWKRLLYTQFRHFVTSQAGQMKQDKRRSLKLAVASFSTISFWTTPMVIAVSLPAHAQVSLCDPVDAGLYDSEVTNVQCIPDSPNRVSFDIQHNYGYDLTIRALGFSTTVRNHISPNLPFVMTSGSTTNFVVESTLDNITGCPDLSGFGYLADGGNCFGFLPAV